MSRARRIPDSERTATMLDLIHRKYPHGSMSLSHVVVEEVAPGTGFRYATRYADALVLGVWPSSGLTLEGFEVKASRADLKKELSDPTKHQALARYCDHWTLVAWDESVLVDGIPDEWGILLTVEVDGAREFVTHRRATKRTPEPWPREFVCSLVRNAYQQAPGAALLGRACGAAADRARRQSEQSTRDAMSAVLEPLARALHGPYSWKWPKEARDPDALVKLATDRLAQLPLAVPA